MDTFSFFMLDKWMGLEVEGLILPTIKAGQKIEWSTEKYFTSGNKWLKN